MTKLSKPVFYICLLIVVLVSATWILSPGGIDQAKASMVEYRIEQLTCGSCVSNIEKALARLDGVGSIEVNLAQARGRVVFDPSLTGSQEIARLITGTGYPATVRLELSPDEYADLRNEHLKLGQKYIARIGDRLIPRSDFEQLVQNQLDNGKGQISPGVLQNLRLRVWQELMPRELMLAAAGKNGVLVQSHEIDARLAELRKGHDRFDQIVSDRYGGLDLFRERLREDLIINRNLEEHVYPGISDPQQQRSIFQSWYAGLDQSMDIVIFDPTLEQQGQTGSGCRCCG